MGDHTLNPRTILSDSSLNLPHAHGQGGAPAKSDFSAEDKAGIGIAGDAESKIILGSGNGEYLQQSGLASLVSSIESSLASAQRRFAILPPRPLFLSESEIFQDFALGNSHIPGAEISDLSGVDVLQQRFLPEDPSLVALHAAVTQSNSAMDTNLSFFQIMDHAWLNFQDFSAHLQVAFKDWPWDRSGNLKGTHRLEFASIATKAPQLHQDFLNAELGLQTRTIAYYRLRLLHIEETLVALEKRHEVDGVASLADGKNYRAKLLQIAQIHENIFYLSGEVPDGIKASSFNNVLAKVYQENGDHAQAKTFFLRGVDLLQKLEIPCKDTYVIKSAPALVLIAEGLQGGGLYSEAIQVYDRAWTQYDWKKIRRLGQSQLLQKKLTTQVAFCRRQIKVKELLANLGDQKQTLEKQKKIAPLAVFQINQLDQINLAIHLIGRFNAVTFPMLPNQEQPDVLTHLREKAFETLAAPLSKASLQDLLAELGELEKGAQIFHAAVGSRVKFLKSLGFPSYLVEYVKKTGDTSVINFTYKDPQKLPPNFNREKLEDSLPLQAYRLWRTRSAGVSNEIERAVRFYQGGIESRLKYVNTLKGLREQTSFLSSEILAVTQDYIGNGLHIELSPVLQAWQQGVEEIRQKKNPNHWLQSQAPELIADLKVIKTLLKELEEKSIPEVNPSQIKFAVYVPDNSNQNIDVNLVNAVIKDFIPAEIAKLKQQYKLYQKHAKTLKQLDAGGNAVLAEKWKQAFQALEKFKHSDWIAGNSQEALQTLAYAKSMAFRSIALMQRAVLNSLSPRESVYRDSKLGPTYTWQSNPAWEALQCNFETQVSALSSQVTSQDITVFLKASELALNSLPIKIQQDLPKQLQDLIDAQTSHWTQAYLSAGAHLSPNKTYDQLLSLFGRAEKLLSAGDIQGAWAAYELTIASSSYQIGHQEFKDHQQKMALKEGAVQLGILIMTGLLTQGASWALAPNVMARAASVGTFGSFGRALVVESMIFPVADKFVRYAGYKAGLVQQNPFYDVSGRLLDPLDYGVEFFGMMAVLGGSRLLLGPWNKYIWNRMMFRSRTKIPLLVKEAELAGGVATSAWIQNQFFQKHLAMLSPLAKAKYHAGAGVLELAGLHAGKNVATILQVAYQNTRFDREISLSEALSEANSMHTFVHSAGILGGLKLSGLATGPFQHKLKGPWGKRAMLRENIAQFEKMRIHLEKKMSKEMMNQDPSSQGSHIIRRPESRAELEKFIEWGNQIFSGPRSSKSISEEQFQQWNQARLKLQSSIESLFGAVTIDSGTFGRFERTLLGTLTSYRPIPAEGRVLPPITKKPVFLFGGAGNDHTCFTELPLRLRMQGYDVQVFALPKNDPNLYTRHDFLRSLREATMYEKEAYADIEKQFQVLLKKHPGKIVVGGFSLGGNTALRLYQGLNSEQQARIGGLVLAAPAITSAKLDLFNPRLRPVGRRLYPWAELLKFSPSPVTLNNSIDPEIAPQIYRMVPKSRMGIVSGLFYIEGGAKSTEQLGKVDHKPPVLLIHAGDKDPTVSPRAAKIVKEAFGDLVEEHLIQDGGHWVFAGPRRERPFEAVEKFLSSTNKKNP